MTLPYVLITSLGQEEGELTADKPCSSLLALSLALQHGVLSDAIGSWKGSFI